MEFRVTTPQIGIPVYTDKELKAATNRIYQIGDSIMKNMYEIAAIIASVEAHEWYKKDGFKSVHEWTESAFGIKKTLSYNLLRIGSEWTAEIHSTASGKVIGHKSNLLINTVDDFTVSQVQQMLPIGRVAALELIGDGEISPDMTCKDIKAAVKAWRKKRVDVDAEAEAEDKPRDITAILHKFAGVMKKLHDDLTYCYNHDADGAHWDIYNLYSRLLAELEENNIG